MHQNEIWQVFHPNGEPIEGVGWGAILNNPELNNSDAIVGVAVVFLYREGKNGLEFLWQRRAENIDRFPGEWDFSAGGHINLGETLPEAAVREAHEEIGIKITLDDLRFVTMRPFNKNRFAWVYLVDWTGRQEEFHFDDKEVSEVRWVKYAEMNDFRIKFGKAPLKKDELTFACVAEWLKNHGYIQAK